MSKLISIIVPMYNEAKNIQNCLDALIKQSCQNFHVIFIDDGSTDETYNRLTQVLNQSHIEFSYEVLKQNNAGAAKARENGIEKAETEYVMIFDCDDNISENTIELHITSIVHENSPDIILPDFLIESDSGYEKFIFYNNEIRYTGVECLEHSLGGWGVHGCVCAKKSIFEKSYNEYRKYNPDEKNFINNDEVITRLNFFFSKKVVRNYAIYFYQNNLDSTTKKINQNRYLMLNNAVILYEIFGQNSDRIAWNAQKELVSVLWGTFKYAWDYRKELDNLSLWNEKIKKVQVLISSKKKCTLSRKSKIKLMLSHYLLFMIKRN